MNDLPKGWTETVLTDVASNEKFSIVDGPFGSDLKLTDYVQDGTVPVLTTRNLTGTYDPNSVRFISSEKFDQLKRSKIESGDILLAKIGSIGKCSIYPQNAPTAIIPANLCKVTVNSELIWNKFLFWQFNSSEFQERLKDITSATAQPAFSVKRFKTLSVKLPPLNEQKRIVEKLEKLFGKVEAVQARLDKIPAILKRFRQSVLAAACSGKLTADWRLEINCKETVEETIINLKETRSEKSKNLTERDKIQAIYDFVEENESDDLPESWRFFALNKLCESFNYGTSTKSENEGLVPVLRMGNIQNREIDWTDLVFTSDKDEIKKYNLKPNTVLFNRTNSPELVGKTAIYRGERQAIFAGYLIRINNFDCLDSRYLNYCLNTNYAKEFCMSVKSDGVSQSNINAQKLGAFEVPFCPIEEQEEIVRRVEDLFKFADQIEARYKKARSYTDRLSQSILAKAFRGELVPQDEQDEPASVLLERIKAERAIADNQPKPKKIKMNNKNSKKNKEQTIIDVTEALKQAEKELSSKELLIAVGHATDANPEEVEKFFVAVRNALDNNSIAKTRRGNEDWFSLVKSQAK